MNPGDFPHPRRLAMAPDIEWRLGTMGYGYKDWQNGVFYPAGLPARAMLAHYSQIFDAVELDTTFYGVPRVNQVRRWAQLTPDDFVFCPKTPRAVTHEGRLAEAGRLMRAFVDAVRHFGDRLGPILIQFPPEYSRAEIGPLARFLAGLPAEVRFAVEFRHRSWHASLTGELLQAYRVAWVSADYHYLPRRVYKTTDFLYLRWIGRHGSFSPKTYERLDRSEELAAWWADIRSRWEGIRAIYGFFNNDYAGFSPATCNRFKALVGLPVASAQTPQQGRLFD